MNKAPSVSQSENLPSWQWKREKVTEHQGTGPALSVSINTSDPMPCLENNEEAQVFQVACLESASVGMSPLSQNHPVIAQAEPQVLEDGKRLELVPSACIQNSQQAATPVASSHEVLQTEAGEIRENIKMRKAIE